MTGAPAVSNLESIAPLSPMQQGLMFHSLYVDGAAGMYVQQIVCTLRGELDSAHLRSAWAAVIVRHPALRSFFVWGERKAPLQIVCRGVQLPWAQEDWCADGEGDKERRLQTYLQADRRRGFALDRAPLMRVALLRTGHTTHRFVWTFHHLLLDGWCLAIIMRDLLTHYRALARGEVAQLAPPPPYSRYLAWLQAKDKAAARAFWRAELDGFEAPTRLGMESTGPAQRQPGRDADEVETRLSSATTAALDARCRQHRVTLGAWLQAAWAILSSRLSGQQEVLFGATVSGRPAQLAGVEHMVGVFINTLPVRTRLAPHETVVELVRRMLTAQLDREAYAEVPLADIQACSAVPGGTALFESIVVVENYPRNMRDASEDGLTVENIRGHDRTHYPLTLLVMPGAELTLRLCFDCDRYARDAVERLSSYLHNLLESMVQRPEAQVAGLSLIDAEERRRIVKGWNETAHAHERHGALHELIEAEAARHPQREALRYAEGRLTYAELDTRANQLAQRLRRMGAGLESLVGVCMERSPELVVTLLATLKCGAAYVPLDPDSPRARLARVLADAGIQVVVGQAHLADRVTGDGFSAAWLDAADPSLGAEMPMPPAVSVTPDNLAYVIYTSGSTGVPKGVMNSHGAICNRLLWMQRHYALGADDRVLQKTPYTFDVSVWEFFWPLLAGASMVIARPEGHVDAAYLRDLITAESVTTVHFVPPMLEVFLREPDVARCTTLRRVICSGEALSAALTRRFFEHFDCILDNLYGPTEAAVDVTAWRCRPEHAGAVVPIGKPIDNTAIHILDDRLEPVPVGVSGELYIAGINLARGYLARPGLSAERFVANPLAQRPGERLYRTGDLARYRCDGAIEYLGRTDSQVKLRGLRIELGEIGTTLEGHEAVGEAVVLVHGEGPARRLVAYVVPAPGAMVSQAALGAHLADLLPAYMIPQLVTLEALPLSRNGKVDRGALSPPAVAARTAPSDAPISAVERTIAALWCEVLECSGVGANENFFDIGGNSLLLAPIHRALREQFDPDIGMFELFRFPTVRTLAAHLAGTSGARDVPVLHRGESRARLGAGLAERRKGRAARRRS